MLCGWEGNRRSGVALAMRHSLQWFMIIHLRLIPSFQESDAYYTSRFSYRSQWIGFFTVEIKIMKTRVFSP